MKIMVIAAHPNLRESKWNKALMNELKNHPDIFIRDLYQEYQNWSIDVEKEQQLLLAMTGSFFTSHFIGSAVRLF
jgi:glutathione-regulated potassium-efflux system ancillary protein KefG